MVSVERFSKVYQSSPAVSGFSMECRKGEVVGVLGPNGAGKTTVLKAICARHCATSGRVLVCGIDAGEDAEKVRLLTGFVTERPGLPGELKVGEVLRTAAETGLEAQGAGRAARARAVPVLLGRAREGFSLGAVWDERIGRLSTGFLKRVCFAEALVLDPPVVVLDEPTSGLDPSQIVNMRNTVRRLKAERAIVLSTHLMQEVDALCDRVYILNGGKCVACGTGDEIARKSGCASLEEAFFALTAR